MTPTDRATFLAQFATYEPHARDVREWLNGGRTTDLLTQQLTSAFHDIQAQRRQRARELMSDRWALVGFDGLPVPVPVEVVPS